MKVRHSFQKLLTSQTRQKLISIFFEKPSELYYVRELVRKTGEEINSVRRELLNLSHLGVILKEVRGNRLYYWANPAHYLYFDLVILAHQHQGLGEMLQEHRARLGKVRAVFYSQDFLYQHPAPKTNIDLIIIGEVSLKLIDELVNKEETRLAREINYMVMDRTEMSLRLSKRDPILVDFFIKYPALILGNPEDIQK